MNYPRRFSQAKHRMHERWTREDAAPRLNEEIVGLCRLTLEIEEKSGSVAIDSARHVRHVLVHKAPAHFELPCSEPKCEQGGYDLTSEILQGLRARRTSFSGEHECQGNLPSGYCRRVLAYTVHAEYEGE